MKQSNAYTILTDALNNTVGYCGKIEKEMLIKEELGLDSLSLVSLIVELEDRLGVCIADSDLSPEHLLTAGDLIALIERYEK